MSTQKIPIKDTDESARIKKFRHDLDKLQWSDNKRLENLNTIFNKLNDLVLNDLEYYNEKRRENGNTSTWTRRLSLISGTLGALAVILQNIIVHLAVHFDLHIESGDVTSLGAACFVVAAAALTWNKLFGASGGHIRYVMAQFDLGEMMVEFTLEWHQWLNHNKGVIPKDDQVTKAFEMFSKFSKHAYKTVRDETQIWGKSLMDAMEEQYKRSQHNKP